MTSKVVRRIVARFRDRLSTDEIPVWGEETKHWPKTPTGWEDEDIDTDAYGGVWVKEFSSTDMEVKVLIDFTPWVTRKEEASNNVSFLWTAKYWGETKKGSAPVRDYERNILRVLKDARTEADRVKGQLLKRLEGMGGHYDGMGLVFSKEQGDASISIEFEDILDIASGALREAEVHAHYSKGADHEGHYGEQTKRMKYRSLNEIPNVLKTLYGLFDKWNKA